MPLIAITDMMDKHRQEKERREKLSPATELAEGAHHCHAGEADSKTCKDDQAALPKSSGELPAKLKRLSMIDTGVMNRATDARHEHKIDETTQTKLSALNEGSSGNSHSMVQLPHRPKTQFHTKEDTTIAEPDALLG